MRICLIVARARNRVIGRAGGLPWRLPADLKHFKATTMGKPVVMGRRTWQSIGRPLPGREIVVVSRDPSFRAEGARLAPDLDAALALAGEIAAGRGADEIFVAGGAEIYHRALSRADRIYLTEVHAAVEGDSLFPALDAADWRESTREHLAAAEAGDYDIDFVTLDRVDRSA